MIKRSDSAETLLSSEQRPASEKKKHLKRTSSTKLKKPKKSEFKPVLDAEKHFTRAEKQLVKRKKRGRKLKHKEAKKQHEEKDKLHHIIEYVPKKPKLKSLADFDKKYCVFNDVIGKGGFSIVHGGKERKTNLEVAVKVVPKEILEKVDRDMILREMVICKRANHPNIVKTYDMFESRKHFYLVMELLKGGSLSHVLGRCKGHRLPEDKVISVVHKVLFALKYLHGHGITHRDVKLQNILLKNPIDTLLLHKQAFIGVRLADFGMASMEMAKGKRKMYFRCGTPSYVAPEMLGKRGYGPQVDMWSLGVSIYIMVHGSAPWMGEAPEVMYRQIARFESVSSLSPDAWDMSDIGKRFLKKLLCRSSKRLSAEEALRHPWIHQSRSMKGLDSLKGRLVSGGYLRDSEGHPTAPGKKGSTPDGSLPSRKKDNTGSTPADASPAEGVVDVHTDEHVFISTFLDTSTDDDKLPSFLCERPQSGFQLNKPQ